MYKIEKKHYGFHLTFGGFIKEAEMNQWYDESLVALKDMPDKFGVFVDMRELKPLPSESQSKMEAGQKHYKERGMVRSVVVLNDPILTMQFKRIAKQSGIYEWERYIDASSNSDWERIGIAWLTDKVDPDSKEEVTFAQKYAAKV